MISPDSRFTISRNEILDEDIIINVWNQQDFESTMIINCLQKLGSQKVRGKRSRFLRMEKKWRSFSSSLDFDNGQQILAAKIDGSSNLFPSDWIKNLFKMQA